MPTLSPINTACGVERLCGNIQRQLTHTSNSPKNKYCHSLPYKHNQNCNFLAAYKVKSTLKPSLGRRSDGTLEKF